MEREGISVDLELSKSAALHEPTVENNVRIKVRLRRATLQSGRSQLRQSGERAFTCRRPTAKRCPHQALPRAPPPAPPLPAQDPATEDAGSDEEFEEDVEEDIVDRETLKKQSASILDKVTKKTKKRNTRLKTMDE